MLSSEISFDMVSKAVTFYVYAKLNSLFKKVLSDKSMIRIYGIKAHLNPRKAQLSTVINQCMVDALGFPSNKRVQRFFPMETEDFYYPEGRSPAYTVIEINLIAGRTEATRKKLIKLLFERLEQVCGIAPLDVEITLFESPACNWGFRGMTGDEAQLNYEVKV